MIDLKAWSELSLLNLWSVVSFEVLVILFLKLVFVWEDEFGEALTVCSLDHHVKHSCDRKLHDDHDNLN